ncbi:MAG: hypothetical protein KDE59_32650 [Anaerolineales bacterium]|nr:hypothetical protein [Anaerolineales bacterium]
MSILPNEVVQAHSCEYPDFALLDYDLADSANSLLRYSYRPDQSPSIQYVGEIFGTGAGHAFVHGFAQLAGLAYLTKYDGQEYVQSYVTDPDRPDFGRAGAVLSDPALGGLGDGVAIDRVSGRLYLLTNYQTAIYAIDTRTPAAGAVQLAGAPQTAEQYGQFGIEVGPDGRVYVLTVNDTVEVYDPARPLGANYDGVYATGTGAGPYGGRDIAFGPDGQMYVSGGEAIRRYAGPAGPEPGRFLDAMGISTSNGEWPHGLTFHPTTGELFVASFSVSGGIQVYDYAPGNGVAKYRLQHQNPANSDGLPKDIQFLSCADESEPIVSVESVAPTPATAPTILIWPALAGLLVLSYGLGWLVWRQRRGERRLSIL